MPPPTAIRPATNKPTRPTFLLEPRSRAVPAADLEVEAATDDEAELAPDETLEDADEAELMAAEIFDDADEAAVVAAAPVGIVVLWSEAEE